MIYFLLFSIYCLFLYFITKFARSQDLQTNEGEYFVGSYKSNTFSIACSMVAGVVEPVTIIFTFGLILLFGVVGAGLYVAFFATAILMIFIAPYLYEKAKSTNSYTISQFIHNSIGRKTEIIYAVITLLFVVGSVIGAYSANLNIFNFFLHIDKFTATLLTFGITLLYTVFGGFRTVVRTDILQYVIMAFIFIFICATLDPHTSTSLVTFSTDWFKGSFLMFAPVLFFQNLVKPTQWQPILGAKDKETARNGIALGSFFLFIIIAPIIYAAFLLNHLYPGHDPMQVVFALIGDQYANYLPIIFMAFVATLMSSVDSHLFYIGGTVAKVFRLEKILKTENKIVIAQIVTVVVSVLSIGLSMFVASFMTFMLGVLPIVGIVTLSFIGGIFFELKRSDFSIAISMSIGLIIFFFQFFYPPTDYIWNVLPVVATFIVFFVLRK